LVQDLVRAKQLSIRLVELNVLSRDSCSPKRVTVSVSSNPSSRLRAALAQLRGFGLLKIVSRCKSSQAFQKSSLRRLGSLGWATVIFGGGCSGNFSFSFSNNKRWSGSGCV